MTSRKLWLLILALVLVHAVLASALPLVEDEAYYQMWASVPSAGYYDHPPMVAWLIAAGEALFGPGNLGVRAASIGISVLVLLMTFRMGTVLGQDRNSGFRASLYLAAMVPMAAFGFAATPDPASVLFWTAASWALVEANSRRAPNWWLAVGLFAGLGVLSKFTNFFFGLALLIWLFATRQGRSWLRHWQVWAGALCGILVLVPFLLWNMHNGWVGFQRQFGRLGEAEGFSFLRVLTFWASFAVLVTPLTFALVARGIFRPRTPRADDPQVLIWLSAPLVLYLSYHAIKTTAGGQWLVPIFPSLAVLAASRTPPQGWLQKWAAPGGFLLSGALMLVGFWPGHVIIPGHNAFTQGRGWRELRHEIARRMQADDAVWIATDAYGLTAQLWHYMGKDVPVRSMTGRARYLFRPPFPKALCSKKGLFLSRTAFAGGVPYFRISRPEPGLIRHEGKTPLMRYYVAEVSHPLPAYAPACAAP